MSSYLVRSSFITQRGVRHITSKILNELVELEDQSEWYRRLVTEIRSLSDSLSKNVYKKYKLDMLLRIARRVDTLSYTCDECQSNKEVITNLVQDMGNMIQLSDKETSKSYFKTIEDLTKHLQKQHKFVTKGYYVGLWSGIGVVIGAAAGAIMDNSGIGTAIGTVIGLLIGLALDAKAKREDRVI